ncbi:MAG: chemotaxis protein CheC [Elusimicrobia bacterium]|nr:chemotaxis protein CheC [Candidatus Liberimonas magnetica]
MDKFNKLQMDILREIINTGTGHAATALSALIDKKIIMVVPEVKLVRLEKVPEYLGGAQLPVVGLLFKMSNDISGSILLFFTQENSDLLSKLLTADLYSDKDLNKSAIMELGNIAVNSYLNAIAEMMDFKILISVPYYAKDLLGAVIDFLLIEIAEVSEYALLMETFLESPDVKLKGNLIIFPDNKSLDKMFDKVGVGKE